MIKINMLKPHYEAPPSIDTKVRYWLDETPKRDWELAGYGMMLGFWAGIGIAVWMI